MRVFGHPCCRAGWAHGARVPFPASLVQHIHIWFVKLKCVAGEEHSCCKCVRAADGSSRSGFLNSSE